MIITDKTQWNDRLPLGTRQKLSHKSVILALLLIFLTFSLSGCTFSSVNTQLITITLIYDGTQEQVQVTAGTLISEVLQEQNISLSTLDRVEPPVYTQIEYPITVKVIRVNEIFEPEEITTQFERQTIRNESLPEGQTRLIQAGVNGIQQITYRVIYEDGVQVSKSIFQTVTLSDSKPEIIMVGVQTPFTSIDIPGTIAYLSAGNAWVMEGSTGNRRPIVTTGNLDGRIFDLSSDGQWLLFTQKPAADENGDGNINELFAIDVTKDGSNPLDLQIENIIHHAAWVPGSSRTITYSTVEPRSTPPGWQANNDLKLLSFSDTGMVLRDETIIETNSGGIYGWWGTTFEWSADGVELAYARPDGIGFVDIENKTLIPIAEIAPFQTKGDWAWVSGLSWSPSNNILYFTNHGGNENNSPETSPIFDLNAVTEFENQVTIQSQTGMFTYPSTSPADNYGLFMVAYLQTIFPDQSETSRYRLFVMDQDGSNRKLLFPQEGSTGLEPQQVVWGVGSRSSQRFIGLIYQGNLWIISTADSVGSQITGDGSIVKIEWE